MPITFLIADDSVMKAQMLMHFIHKSELDSLLLGATTTEEAKAIIDTEDIQAAFIDYEIPSENGPAVIEYLRAKKPNALVACITSAESEEYKANALSAGADKFISSAYGGHVTEQKVNDLLEEWKVLLGDEGMRG